MRYTDKINTIRQWIDESNNVVVFTGAGISVPSGIPDFRSSTGLYTTLSGEGKRPEYMLSHTCFERQPEDFFAFCRKNIIRTDAEPNDAHRYFTKLEKEGKVNAIITQNIDALHEMSGSEKTITFHGTMYKNYCVDCGEQYSLDYVKSCEGVPHCTKCGGIVRPDVVLYEERIDENNLNNSIEAVSNADVLIVVGTSLIVYPAAYLLDYYKGDKLVLINKDRTPYDLKANIVINDDIIKVVHDLDR